MEPVSLARQPFGILLESSVLGESDLGLAYRE
jgi:hypothetical protein